MSNRPHIVSGARVIVYINGRRYGRAIDFEAESETALHEINGIDEVVPAEIAPTRGRVTGTISCYRIAGDGGFEGLGIVAQFPDVMRQKYFTVALRERGTEIELFRCDYCVCSRQRFSVKKGFAVTTFSFSGIVWNNEAATNGAVSARGLP